MALWASLTSSFYPISGAIHQPTRQSVQSAELRDDDYIAIREVKHGYLVMSDESGNIKLIETSHNRYRTLPEECKFKIKVQKTELLGVCFMKMTSLTDWRGRVCGITIQQIATSGINETSRAIPGILGELLTGPGLAAVRSVFATALPTPRFGSGPNLPHRVVECRFYDPTQFPGSAWQCTIGIFKNDTAGVEGVKLLFGTDDGIFHWQAKTDPPPKQAAAYPPFDRIYVERGSIVAICQQPIINDSMIFRIEKIY